MKYGARGSGRQGVIELGLSLLKLLQAFSHLEVIWDEDIVNNRVHLHLKGAATLIRLPKLAANLEEIRPGAEVHIHFERLDYIDHACLDLLSNWEKQHEASGGTLIVEWEECPRNSISAALARKKVLHAPCSEGR